ncbi:hypothetical protein FN846DRAFT_905396 [Sphaerosporella brunnea]|uniref:Uncharacterized protein n=1 Tax=Sphaerosporella brunnea TaxID=1250544 RepID=A0A5J5F1J7_9PEZI|nr:hypothetical protein FN846DRAFT_905396 [Sphaerosporella brunnea]
MFPSDRPLPRTPSFSRKVAKRVSSLIAKFEALSANQSTVIDPEPPRRRSLSSLITPGGSSSRRSGIRRSIGRRASKILEKVARAGNEDVVPKITPPPKRLLKAGGGRRGRRNASLPNAAGVRVARYTVKKRRVVSDSTEVSGIVLDGPVSLFASEQPSSSIAYAASSILSTPPPPVAKILPSSFFSQLVSEEPPRRRKVKPQTFTDSEDTDLVVVEMAEKVDLRHQFRLKPTTNGTGSGWRRKITPPKISVRELVSRFWQEPSQQQKREAVKVPEQKAVEEKIPVEERDEKYSNIVTAFSDAEDAEDASEAEQEDEGIMLWPGEASPSISSLLRFSTPSSSSVTRPHTSGSIVPTPKTYVSPLRLDTPALPSTKKYRKTPPPSAFFRHNGKRLRYSAIATSPNSASSSESYYFSSSSSEGRGKSTITISPNRGGGITINTGIPAESILTPIPVNAVQGQAIRHLVTQSWGVHMLEGTL